MFLSSIQIVNFRNFEHETFHFSAGANTIVGDNDSGKSNVLTAMRLLLDDSYYASPKRLRDTDFSFELQDWRGHWIIISGVFKGITADEKNTEVCSSLIPESEDACFLNSFIGCAGQDYGIITLFVRPLRSVRKRLSQAVNREEYETIRQEISLNDYEYHYTSRAQTDFTSKSTYSKIVGDLETGQYTDPDNDDTSILGVTLNIRDAQTHLSVVYVDALRDVHSELRKPKNPIRRMMDSLESSIQKGDKEKIESIISDLNDTITDVQTISSIGEDVNERLRRMIGLVYSPELKLQSQLNDDISSLARYLTLKPSRRGDLESLGLGHLNMIYISLKLVEFEITRTRELLNIMLIEEPEAHIHNHIQKSLFDNLKLDQSYTQVIMTTHSVHLSESSEISRLNVLKVVDEHSIVMQPTRGLDEFGKTKLNLPNMPLSRAIERYLDAKRTVLLFSKSVILVEGDGEEILIPSLVKQILGISLDELGIGLVNIGSIAFEYIASLFDNERIRKKCAIVTDQDIQVVSNDCRFYSDRAERLGKGRQEKINSLYKDNPWVSGFYAPHTFEVDFLECPANKKYVESVIEILYKQASTIIALKEDLDSIPSARANAVLKVAYRAGKGWFATLLSEKIDGAASIPEYLLDALVFVSSEIITVPIKLKMINHTLSQYETCDEIECLISDMRKIINNCSNQDYDKFEQHYLRKFPQDTVAIFLNKLRKVKHGKCSN